MPAQRIKFSKRQFTQPQLLAVRCLTRYKNWTFREADVRLGERVELRSVLDLNSVPDYTTLYRFLARLDPEPYLDQFTGCWFAPRSEAVDAGG